MDLEIMAIELMNYHTLEEKEEYLLEKGRIAHIPKNSKLSKIISKIEEKRFYRIGDFFYCRKEEDTDQKYYKICIMNGEFLFENYPLLFEFYDEYVNGYTYTEEDIEVFQKKYQKKGK